ncbi:hypothetical protein FO519_002876 [Halicephalobus sp. NKZ332]|nr:hypothetical protein FO519_002876 [Halicephalobus sp. NKZ332]
MISKLLGLALILAVFLNISFAAPLDSAFDVDLEKRAFHMGLGKRSEDLIDVIPMEDQEFYLEDEGDFPDKDDLNKFHLGFGKRGLDKRLNQFHMGLGKRAPMYMGLGKRAFHMGLGKRSAMYMGLGKRESERPEFYTKKSFHMGLGKRSFESPEFYSKKSFHMGLGKR